MKASQERCMFSYGIEKKKKGKQSNIIMLPKLFSCWWYVMLYVSCLCVCACRCKIRYTCLNNTVKRRSRKWGHPGVSTQHVDAHSQETIFTRIFSLSKSRCWKTTTNTSKPQKQKIVHLVSFNHEFTTYFTSANAVMTLLASMCEIQIVHPTQGNMVVGVFLSMSGVI